VVNCHSGETDCVAIGKTTHIAVFVIPGLTRNPVFFQSVTLLDAGSVILASGLRRSPEWRDWEFLRSNQIWDLNNFILEKEVH
jgi:hypothetical protein